MILKAKARGQARQLGAYLLRMADNDHVEVHEVRGFIAQDVPGAMREADAIAQGTRCKNHLFSMSLNPPQTESVSSEVFDQALSQIEERTGLTGQPRIVVFHEKDGRRHCHAVWSRIDAQTMTAVELPFYKMRLREVSRQLYIENGWKMPRGLMDSKARDPRNFELADWQQARRTGRDPRELKSIIQECWAVSDSRAAFQRALEERGLYLAKGDRRGHVALTYEGQVRSIARDTGKKAKEVRAKLGEADDLRSVEETKAYIASQIAPRLRTLIDQAQADHQRRALVLEDQRLSLREQHDRERANLDEGQRARQEAEGRSRNERLRKGLLGLWDRMVGEYARLKKQNEAEAWMAAQRDREQRHILIQAQLSDRRDLQTQIQAERRRHALHLTELHRDLTRQQQVGPEQSPGVSERFQRAAEAPRAPTLRTLPDRQPTQDRKRGLDLER